jgi:hypothetical protein
MTLAAGGLYDRGMSKPRSRTVVGFLSACSLVLCLAVAGLWMRSVVEMDQVRSADPFRQTTVVSANGELCVETVTALMPEFDPGVSRAHALPTQYCPRILNWQVAGLGGGREVIPTFEGPIRYDTLMIPLWLIVVLLAVPPVLLWDAGKSAAGRSDSQDMRPAF